MFYFIKQESGNREQGTGNSRERPLVVPDKGKERSVPTCPGSEANRVPYKGKSTESIPITPTLHTPSSPAFGDGTACVPEAGD